MTDAPPPDKPARDRAATEARLLAAAQSLLAADGFRGFGVNAVARAAGVDKQLIYRYFGDLDGLLDRLGADLGFWIGDIAPESPTPAADSYGAGVALLLRRYLAALRASPATRAVLAWELVDRGDQIARLGAARSRAVQAWVATQRPALGAPPADVDAPALNALMLAALHHLALREGVGDFAGLDLRDPATWARIEAAVTRIATLLDPP